MRFLFPTPARRFLLPSLLAVASLAHAQPDGDAPTPQPARIYPTPQRCELAQEFTTINNISYTQLRSGDTIAKGSVEQGSIALPEVEGAYAILIKKGELQVFSYDAAGRHYAKQTLMQLLNNPLLPKVLDAHQDPYPENYDEGIARLGKLPLGCIVDWPDLPYRGVVEGYYGQPWSHEARKQQMAFYGRNKLNTYIWAPKDDPYHHGEDCRKPYPEEVAAQISELCEVAKKNHVKFVWSIHPANTIDWEKNDGQDDLKALLVKLELMYDLGVRHFACAVDDSSGAISKASRQAELCNYITEHFIENHEGLEPLIMCPTGYTKLWTPADWLRDLGAGLKPDTKVMWTGDSVICNITQSGQEWVTNALGRPTFIWWNWPCTDYKRSHLAMGKCYGLDQSPEMKNLLSGFVANPMEWPEASKFGLFGVADYSWNIAAYDENANWRVGMERLYPHAAASLLKFAEHNSDLGRNSDGYMREESVELAPLAEGLLAALNDFKTAKRKLPQAQAEAVYTEFLAIIKSGQHLLSEPELALLRAEIKEWISLYTTMGQLGKSSLELLDPSLVALSATEEEKASKPAQLADMLRAWVAMEDATNQSLRPKVGTVVLAPLVEGLARSVSDCYYQAFSGGALAVQDENTIHFSSSVGEGSKDMENIFDRDRETYWSTEAKQANGDWFLFDLGSEQTVAQIRLIMAGIRPKDFPATGEWHHSLDGETWTLLAEETAGAQVAISTGTPAISARYLRMTITGAKTGNWLSICEFGIENEALQEASSSIKAWQNLSILHNEQSLGINRKLEFATMAPKDNISLNLLKPLKAKGISIDLANGKALKQCELELTLEDGSSSTISLPQPEKDESGIIIPEEELPSLAIKGMKLTYTGKNKAEVKLSSFALLCEPTTARSDKKALHDRDLLSAWDASSLTELPIELPEGCQQLCIVSTNLEELEIEGAAMIGGSDSTVRHIVPQEGVRQLILRSPRPQKGALIHEVIYLQSGTRKESESALP